MLQEPSTSGRDSDDAGLTRHAELYQRAELYYAYDLMHKSSTCPFRTVFAATLLNAACYLLMHLPTVRSLAHSTQQGPLQHWQDCHCASSSQGRGFTALVILSTQDT